MKPSVLYFFNSSDSLVADERGAVDLLDQRVVVAAHSTTHNVLTVRTAVVETVLDHKVHRSSRVQIHAQVLKVVQHVRVLDGETGHQNGPPRVPRLLNMLKTVVKLLWKFKSLN